MARALKIARYLSAFALTGRLADCYYTQGVALGQELLPFQGVWGKTGRAASGAFAPPVLEPLAKLE